MPPLESCNPIDSLFVLTGGPGSGKSTLIAALGVRGFVTMPEAGRAIIREQVASGGNALPWADRSAFAERMFAHDLRSYRQALALRAPVLFDRGLPDTAGYLRLCGLPVPETMLRQIRACRYHQRVFAAPPWREIFARDQERKQSFAEAEATFEAVTRTYLELGYEIVRLLPASVEERAQFVMKETGLLESSE